MEWRNWSGSQRCSPRLERPGTRHELAEIVARAPGPVRVTGAGHSFSGAATTDGTLLQLDALARVLEADTASGLVRVEAGIRLHALSAELHARGLAMPNLGDIDVQSLAGALSTGTHGTGARLPNLSGHVVGLELVLGDGSERTVDAGQLLRAARVGLGAFGVIAAVTLRCVPAFRLHARERPEPLEDVLAGLQERADAHDHFEFFTFPHADVALTRTWDRTQEAPRHPGPVRAYVSDVVLDNRAFQAINLLARRRPRLIPRLNRFASSVASRREQVDWSHRVFASPRLVRFEEMEYAIPRERAAEGVRVAREILARHPVSFPVELRFSAADDALLSPAHGRATAYVAVHLFQGMDYAPAFREVEAAMSALGGRPHWGKRSFLSAAELAPRYPGWDAFQAARAQLDPDGRFASAWLRHMVG
jgi:L-gulono-1,4-lactone dehydrogenase